MNEVVITVKGSDQFSSTADKVNKSATGMGATLSSVGKIAGGFVLAQGLIKAPEIIGGFVSAASDMNETLTKSSIVFGDSNAAILDWASTSSTSMGLSKQKTLEATSTFGNFLTAMGQTKPVAADMSKAMVILANDLGSFNNVDPTEALMALRSGLAGEVEPMRRFGVAIDESAVKAQAMKMGLGEVGRELTQQEKIQARYALIMQQTTTAQGDFTRTQDGMANQSKILSAQWEDLKTQIGTALLPVVLELTKGLNELAGAIMSDVVPVVKEWYEKHQPEINAQMEEFKTVLREDVMPAIEALVELFKTLWPVLGPLVETVFKDILNTITTQLKIAADVIKIVTAIISGDWGGAWEGMKQLVSDVWDGIYTHIALKVALVRDVVMMGVELIRGKIETGFSYVWGVVIRIWDGIESAIVEPIKHIIDWIEKVIRKAGELANLGGIAGKVIGKAMDLTGFAVGGVSSGGLAIVGERGPELVALPGGSRVFSNSESRQMAGGGTTIVNVYPQQIILQGDPQSGLASLGAMFA